MVLFSKKLAWALEEDDSKSKKIWRLKKVFKKYFRSPKKRTVLRITLFALLTIGIGMTIFFHLPSRQLIKSFSWECRKFFKVFNENLNSNTDNINSQTEREYEYTYCIGKFVKYFETKHLGLIMLFLLLHMKILQSENQNIPIDYILWFFKFMLSSSFNK